MRTLELAEDEMILTIAAVTYLIVVAEESGRGPSVESLRSLLDKLVEALNT